MRQPKKKKEKEGNLYSFEILKKKKLSVIIFFLSIYHFTAIVHLNSKLKIAPTYKFSLQKIKNSSKGVGGGVRCFPKS
jgi:hypothetical protein